MNSKKSSHPKCIVCGKKTTMACHGCKDPICNRHAGVIARSAYCPNCMTEMKKKGLLKSWGLVLIMGIVAILLFTFL